MDGGFSGFEVGFFFIEQGEFCLAFGVVFSGFGEEGAAKEGVLFFFFGDEDVEGVVVFGGDQQVVGDEGGVGVEFGVVAEDDFVAVEQGFQMEQVVQAFGDFFKAWAFFQIVAGDFSLQEIVEHGASGCAGNAQGVELVEACKVVKMFRFKAQNDGGGFAFSANDYFVFGVEQPLECLRPLL